jgi:hypothetical protein
MLAVWELSAPIGFKKLHRQKFFGAVRSFEINRRIHADHTNAFAKALRQPLAKYVTSFYSFEIQEDTKIEIVTDFAAQELIEIIDELARRRFPR